MPTQRTPKSLHDVSHLFLSQRKTPVDPCRSVEAVIWLVNLESPVNRAFFAAGCANAIAAKELFVTLVEVGCGFPNIGYYYSLGPVEYAVPAVDDSHLVTGIRPPYTRFASAARIETMDCFAPPDLPGGSTHILLSSFDYIKGGKMDDRCSAVEHLCGRLLPSHGGVPDAMVVCDAGEEPVEIRRFIGDARRGYPGTPIFRVTSCAIEEQGFGVDESIVLPGGLKCLWSNRTAPGAPFFDGFASNLLQVLSHRRRKAVRDVHG
jgi:hypothetical protein